MGDTAGKKQLETQNERIMLLLDRVLSGCTYHGRFSLDQMLEELGAPDRLEKEAVLNRFMELDCVTEDSLLASSSLSPKGKTVKFAGGYSEYLRILESETEYIRRYGESKRNAGRPAYKR